MDVCSPSAQLCWLNDSKLYRYLSSPRSSSFSCILQKKKKTINNHNNVDTKASNKNLPFCCYLWVAPINFITNYYKDRAIYFSMWLLLLSVCPSVCVLSLSFSIRQHQIVVIHHSSHRRWPFSQISSMKLLFKVKWPTFADPLGPYIMHLPIFSIFMTSATLFTDISDVRLLSWRL